MVATFFKIIGKNQKNIIHNKKNRSKCILINPERKEIYYKTTTLAYSLQIT